MFETGSVGLGETQLFFFFYALSPNTHVNTNICGLSSVMCKVVFL